MEITIMQVGQTFIQQEGQQRREQGVMQGLPGTVDHSLVVIDKAMIRPSSHLVVGHDGTQVRTENSIASSQ
jgi:hypothetical protein